MNVLVLDSECVWRGGQEQIYTLIEGLAARGVHVALVAPAGAPLAQRARAAGVHVVAASWSGEFAPGLLAPLWRILRARRWDVVHFNTPAGILPGALLSRLAGVPLRVWSRRVNFPLRAPWGCWKYMWAAESIIAVSASIAGTLAAGGLPASRLHVVHEGVDADPIERAAPLRLFPPPCVVIGCAAFMSPEKGHNVLLEAFALLRARRPRARLALAGDGPLRRELQARAARLGVEPAVRFAGFLTDPGPFLRGLDVFVLPSLSEGLSSAILAAMAAGLPVAASDVGGIPEVVERGATGLLVPPGDPAALAEALEQLVDGDDLRRRQGEAGRARVRACFTLARKVERTLAVYTAGLAVRQGGA